MKIVKKVLNIFIIAMLVILILVAISYIFNKIDYSRVQEGKLPICCIKSYTLRDRWYNRISWIRI